MAGTTIVSTLMVGITVLNGQITSILARCLQILAVATFNTFGEAEVT
jgi:hypothetical protein